MDSNPGFASTWEQLQQRLATARACVGIVGLGYVGVSLAQAVVRAGFEVLGFDRDSARAQSIGEQARSNDAPTWLQAAADSGQFRIAKAASELQRVDVVLICVQTPLDAQREPDLRLLRRALSSVAENVKRPVLISVESTIYPRATREIALPLFEKQGLVHGRDFLLAYSPERVDPGNRDWPLERIPKLLAGLDQAALTLATVFYQQMFQQLVPVASLEVAEASKLLENAFRAVNIALVNEMKALCEQIGVNIWDVVEAARSKPFGFMSFAPGPGPGGHCIPIDPHYLAWTARHHGTPLAVVETALKVNESMVEHVQLRIKQELGKRNQNLAGARIALLGVAYKPDIDDARESPALRLFESLESAGARVSYHDPHVPELQLQHGEQLVTSEALSSSYLREQDCVVILTAHSSFDWDFVVQHSQLVLDTRNATQRVNSQRERIAHG